MLIIYFNFPYIQFSIFIANTIPFVTWDKCFRNLNQMERNIEIKRIIF